MTPQQQQLRLSREALVQALADAGAEIKGNAVKCPFHDDHNPSGGIYQDKSGIWRFKCQTCSAGGDVFDVIARATGRLRADVLKEYSGDCQTPQAKPTAQPKRSMVFETIEAVKSYCKGSGAVQGVYLYDDEAGQPFGAVVRIQTSDGKTYKQFKAIDKNRYELGAPGKPWKLYNLPDVLKADFVFVVEGEKAADALNALGFTATTALCGAGKASHSDWSILAGKKIMLWPDHDEPGRKHCDDVERALATLNPMPTAYRIDPAKLDLPEKGDAFDFIAKHGDNAYDEIVKLINTADPVDLEAVQTVQDAPGCDATPEPMKYQPFPIKCLPGSVGRFIQEAAAALGCDASYLALPTLAVLASAIGNSRRLRLKNSWYVPSSVWAVTVAESGTQKSPSYKEALRPVYALQFQRHKEYEQAKNAFNETESGKRPRYEPVMCSDITIEALADRLNDAPRGLLIARDELSGWFKSFNQYKGGRGGDIAHWLELYDDGVLNFDRKTNNQTIYIVGKTISVTGTIQPGVLKRCLTDEFFENGLAARFLLAMPPQIPKQWTEADIDERTREAYASIYKSLFNLPFSMDCQGNDEPLNVELSAEAKALWVAFYDEHNQQQAKLSGPIAAAWSKLEAMAARLALVIYCTKQVESGGKADGELDRESMAAGIELVRWFGNETRRIYAMLKPETAKPDPRRKLIELIKSKGGRATPRELGRSSTLFDTVEQWKTALDELVKAGLGRWETEPVNPKGGRPSMVFELTKPDD